MARSKEDDLIVKSADQAPQDAEVILAQLESLQGERGRWTSDKGDRNVEYERLRDLATDLLTNGPRYFLDGEGVKMVAVRQQGDRITIDPAILDELPANIVEEIAPRKIDNEAFKRAFADRRISNTLFVKHARSNPTAAFVKFIRADSGSDSE